MKKKMLDLTPFDYLQMVMKQEAKDTSHGKVWTATWISDLRDLFERSLKQIEELKKQNTDSPE